MSGIHRTGLFSRNFTNTLSNRNKALSSTASASDKTTNSTNATTTTNENNTDNTAIQTASRSLTESPVSLSASFVKDQDGFDDVDAYFNQAVTPQRTPTTKTTTITTTTTAKAKTPKTASKSGTPLKGTAGLVARPVALISSKIAAHYQKEPRFAVSMSEVAVSTGEDGGSFESQVVEEKQEQQQEYFSNQPAFFDDDYLNENNDDDALMNRLVEDLLVSEGPTTAEPERREKQPTTTANNNTKKKTNSSRRRVASYYPSADFDGETGKRQSKRQRMTPLRYWANEKVCYGRAEDPTITLPVIVNVIKKPELDDPTFMAGRTSRRPRNPNAVKLKAQAFGPECDVEAAVRVEDAPPSDDSDYDEDACEEVRTLALSHHHVSGDEVKGHGGFRIHTMFTEGSFMSAGQLLFPPGTGKPAKNSARHALVFYVISGSFQVSIHRTTFVIGPGGQFHVPRNNAYSIAHISTDKQVEGRLFFCHCKDNREA